MHTPESLKYPAVHRQSLEAELPAAESECLGHEIHVDPTTAPTTLEYVPLAQSLQSPGPEASLYLPASQLLHALDSFPFKANPASHTQTSGVL